MFNIHAIYFIYIFLAQFTSLSIFNPHLLHLYVFSFVLYLLKHFPHIRDVKYSLTISIYFPSCTPLYINRFMNNPWLNVCNILLAYFGESSFSIILCTFILGINIIEYSISLFIAL